MDADDLQALYKLVRGNKSATVVLDAHAAFLEKRMSDARAKLIEAREKFADSRSRILRQDLQKQVDAKAKDAERQLKKLQRKKDKVVEALEAFDELLPQLAKLAARDAKDAAQASEPTPANIADTDSSVGGISESEEDRQQETCELEPATPEYPELVTADEMTVPFIREFDSSNDSQRLDLIGRKFGFREISSDDDIHGDAVYFIRTDEQSFLVQTPHADKIRQEIRVENLSAGAAIKPFSRSAFVDLGRQRKMVLLTRRRDFHKTEVGAEPNDPESVSASPSTAEAGDDNDPDSSVIDMGAFSQLLTSAQRSGLVPGADQVGYVRDREFRLRKYDEAFQTINGLYSQFTSAASQRTQRLAREDADISAGRIKISPKDLLAKRARDRAQTQEVERATRRFQIVLEGLRVLMSR